MSQSRRASAAPLPSICSSTWLFLSGLWQVGHTRVRAHEDVAGVQSAFQEALFGLRYMNAAQWGLGQRVGRNEGQAVHPHLVDAVYGLGAQTESWVLV